MTAYFAFKKSIFALGALAVALAFSSNAWAADSYQSLTAEFNKAEKDFRKAYATAKTDEERGKLFQTLYPQPDKFAPRFMGVAEKNPKTDEALDCLVWVATHERGGRNDGDMDKALGILSRDFIRSDKLGEVSSYLAYSRSEAADTFLRDVVAKSPNRVAQGRATFALAEMTKHQGKDKEAEKLYEQIEQKYRDVKGFRGTIGDSAKSALFEIRNLSIGKTAPEIKGQDVEGKAFALSAYRGKVVVIDFFGDW